MPPRVGDASIAALVVAIAGLQIGYPLTQGAARDHLTFTTVVVAATASIAHAALTRGRRGVACCAAAACVGLSVEIAGVHTGIPFGEYHYSSSLGVRIAGVPIIAGLAWTMLAWPAALVARRLANSIPVRVLVGAWALASWDLFLDPQMVAAGHWQWAHPDLHLPGVPGVPLTNFAGWLLVSIVISLAVQGILGHAPSAGASHAVGTSEPDDRSMVALFLWTYASSVVGLLAFLNLEAAALWGALGMGLVAVPLVIAR
jgi:uncharacterized membrane protein